MFCPTGYVTLAELWKDFFARYRVPHTHFVMAKYGHSDHDLGEAYGSPDDYCESVFLSTLAELPVVAARADGHVTRIETLLNEGRSNLFLKMSAFESFLAASDPNEAGPDGLWLRRLGSDHFEAWDVTTQKLEQWKAHFCETNSDVPKQPYFHTLPYAFERGRYLVPDEAPPWICDVIDEFYLPRIVTSFGGCALCVELKIAEEWRERVMKASQAPQLEDRIVIKSSRVGRPNKTAVIKEAYQRLFPDGHTLTLKELTRQLRQATAQALSAKTVQRALDELRQNEDKTKG